MCNPSVALEFKFQLLRRTEKFAIYSSLKCCHDHTVHRGRHRVKNERSVQCTESGNEGLVKVKQKIKFTLLQAMKAHSESRGRAYTFFNLGASGDGLSKSRPVRFTPGENPVSI
jgi:hypothetical protein